MSYTNYSDLNSSSIFEVMECPYTEREHEIIALLCHLRNSKEISEQLSISQGTVKRHLENMRTKTGCRNLMELAVFSIGSKWVKM